MTIIKCNGPSLGLHVNITKCELISSAMPVQSQSLNEFIAVSLPDVSLLGAPLLPRALQDAALKKKLKEFKILSSNIKLINAYNALLILKASSSTSHVLFMLRCSPCLGSAILSKIDEVLNSKISHSANVVLFDVQWIRANFPVKAGGLGVHRTASLALPAYLAFLISTTSLQDLILIRSIAAVDKYYTLYRSN